MHDIIIVVLISLTTGAILEALRAYAYRRRSLDLGDAPWRPIDVGAVKRRGFWGDE